VLDKKLQGRCQVLTEEKLVDIDARLDGVFAKKIIGKTSSASWPVDHLSMNHHKMRDTSRCKIIQVHPLQTQDSATRINLCRWFILPGNEGILDQQRQSLVLFKWTCEHG
jgi:hypothetical protein